MRNIHSGLVFCDVVTLMANIKHSYRPLNCLVINMQDLKHQVTWGKQVFAIVGHDTCTFHLQRMAVFLHLELFFPRVFSWKRNPGWSISWLKDCAAWRHLSLLVFTPDTDWWWTHIRQCWHLPLGNWSHKGRERPGAEMASGASGRQAGESELGSGESHTDMGLSKTC